MTVLNKIYGGAGCGKTHHLMQELEKLINAGTDVRSIAMMTLTRAARREFIARAVVMSGNDEKELRWFGTMHQITWRLLDLDYKENAVTAKRKKAFFESYEDEPSGKLPNIVKINEIRRNCMEENTKEGLLQTQRETGLEFVYRNRNGRFEYIDLDEIIEFGGAWEEFLNIEGLYDFTRMIEVAHSAVCGGDVEPPFSQMMVDEFQDFSPLQHALYVALSEHMENVWICGDDRQVIYRFAGASPAFLIDDPVTPGHEYILPRTWRYGKNILENSLKYVRGLKIQKERDIEPAEHEGRVYSLRGNDWIEFLHRDGTTSAYLVRTNSQVPAIIAELDAQGIVYGLLGKSNSQVETLLRNYNTVAALERGDSVLVDDIRALIQNLPVTAEMVDAQTTIDGVQHVKKAQLLKRGIKTRIDDPTYLLSTTQDFFTGEEFADAFLAGWSWGDINLLNYIKGMNEFIREKGVRFPEPFDMEIHHYVGTIHKFKGNEADNVFLFRQMPYPISDRVLFDERARDDERRCFYVGATRARHNLYEIDDYFFDYFGNVVPSVAEIL